MRFRAKFPTLQVVIALTWFAMLLASLHKGPGRDGFLLMATILWVCMSLWTVANSLFLYWELDSEKLRERRLWSVREVGYAEIVAIGPWGATQASKAKALEITFGKLGSALDPRTSIIATPFDRQTFLSILRARALRAEFTA